MYVPFTTEASLKPFQSTVEHEPMDNGCETSYGDVGIHLHMSSMCFSGVNRGILTP
jgi:hypothetical protein